MRFGILKKFLTAFLTLSLIPLIILSFYTWIRIDQAGENIIDSSRNSLIKNTMSLLEGRARAIAGQVELFLKGSSDNLHLLSKLPIDSEVYQNFIHVHKRNIWIKGDAADKRDRRVILPLYREITYIDKNGNIKIHIRDGRNVKKGINLNHKFMSFFGPEDYFRQTSKLPTDKIFVSHLVGKHVYKEEQLRGAVSVEKADGLFFYNGIIRFAKAVYRDGKFVGVVSLALDHRHLMEYTQHVLPFGNREVVFPSYKSGNYAFMFDDQGWMITHPKFWDIRGYDRKTGELTDPQKTHYNKDNLKKGIIPFNLLYVPFIHENYQYIGNEVIAGRSGVTETSSVGDISRVLAFAPIKFGMGVYEKTGSFGGVTLGVQTDVFQKAVNETPAEIYKLLNKTINNFAVIIILAGCVVSVIAYLLSRSFTRPILQLTENVKEISKGNYDVAVNIKSGDELENLGENFSDMGKQLKKNQESLVKSLKDLEKSKNEMERIFSHMKSGLLVIDQKSTVVSANLKAMQFLECESERIIGTKIESVLSLFPDILGFAMNRIMADKKDERISNKKSVDGKREYFETQHPDGRRICVESSVSFIKTSENRKNDSTLLIFRDVTQRKNMEKHLNRSDRLVSLGILAAGMAHEIRNPLTGISLLLDDLHDRMENKSEDREMMQRALEEIEKLENIVTGLMEFASNTGSKPVKSSLSDVISQTLFFVKKQCNRQGVKLICHEGTGIPDLNLDPERIRQALLNIILNALNVLKNSGEIKITTSLTKDPEILSEKGAVELAVHDNGTGISDEDITFIFDPFFTKDPEGFGLGLSITHSIIEEHNGKITVESEQGKGTTFKIYLPLP